VKYLLSGPADVNAHEEEKIGETPLGEVAAECTYEMAELLETAGANPIIPGWMLLTALDRCQQQKERRREACIWFTCKAARKKFHYES